MYIISTTCLLDDYLLTLYGTYGVHKYAKRLGRPLQRASRSLGRPPGFGRCYLGWKPI